MAFGYNINQRKINKRNHIVDLFRQHNVLSKAKAKKLSGYSMDTVISIFNSLLDDRIIIHSEGAQKAKGRKASFFTLNNDRRLYVGITFNQSAIITSLVSFSQNILEERKSPLTIGISRADFIQKIKDNIFSMLSADENYIDKLAAAGCSIPGDIDIYSGVLRTYTFMPQLNGMNFRQELSSILKDIPLIIDHNIKSMMSYLMRDVDLLAKHERILFVSSRSGTANGYIHGGRLIIGHGEMGHVKVSDEDKKCICGRSGCLDCYFSINAFIEMLPEYGKLAGNSTDMDTGSFLKSLAVKYVEGNNPVAHELDRRLYYFTVALLDVINLLAPELVILSGDLLQVYGDPAVKIKKIIREHFPSAGYVTHFQNAAIAYRDYDTNIASHGICFEMIKNDWGYYSEVAKKNPKPAATEK